MIVTRHPTKTLFARGTKAFTLVEMLVVVAIIAALLALSVASVRSQRSRILGNTGEMVVDLLEEARQLAIQWNTRTMVALVTSTSSPSRNQQLLTILSYSPDTTTNHGWSMTGKWHVVPDGIEVAPEPEIEYPDYGEPFFQPNTLGVSIERENIGTKFSMGTFLPNGCPESVEGRSKIIFVQEKNAPTRQNYYQIIINPTTGIPIVKRP